ncbi:hypothetical protein OV203_20050 [Nannocystis sp. ILAH1]|uniref:hypothetical protein n=1 Tax=unclassified Nannocystis TaxID=2627009 RepID=UPI00226DC54A|nr:MULTISPECIES: hypothetical protein [unclassified Nannocystis]MCY0989444.1 hypothetical protein [Nannocystis sp. ILAH1]MCY1064857.1 hypothetical protein [Nannocystis sp. RBIL2]
MASIAVENGFRMETLWNHPDNARLKALRKDPYVLAPGDVVRVPALRPRIEKGETDRVHRFRRRGVPEKFRMRFLDEGSPRADIPYVFEVGGEHRRGQTDADGWVEQWIPPGALQATLTLTPPAPEDGEPLEDEVYDLLLGALDPEDTERGARSRLRSLGYLTFEDEDEDDAYALALYTFQLDEDLEPTGTLDAPTSRRLRAVYGS